MGKQAKTKEKRRREEQKRSKLRTRALATLNETFAEASARVAAAYEAASPAEREAMDAHWAELAAAASTDPKGAGAAANMAERIVTLPVSRNGSAAVAAGRTEYPRLRAKVLSALNILHGDVPAACAHLTPTTEVGSVCVDEPSTVRCVDCMDEHERSDHTPQWNHQCLECGSVDMRGISPVMIPPILGLPIRFGDGEHLLLSPVVMTGLGLCNPCRLAAGKKRARTGGGSGA